MPEETERRLLKLLKTFKLSSKSLLERARKKIEEEKVRKEKIVKETYLKQISFIKKYKKKRFEITPEFYNAALEELKKSFRMGQEMGMLVFFEEDKEKVYTKKFYSSDWIFKNKYGYSTPFKLWVEDTETRKIKAFPLGSFSLNYSKFYDLLEKEKELVLHCHTHALIAEPSSVDLEIPFCGIIIGFRRITPKLRKLIEETFYQLPKYEEIRIRRKDYDKLPKRYQRILDKLDEDEMVIHRRLLFDFSEKLYQEVLEECIPTIRLYYVKNKKLKRIPLYLQGKELE